MLVTTRQLFGRLLVPSLEQITALAVHPMAAAKRFLHLCTMLTCSISGTVQGQVNTDASQLYRALEKWQTFQHKAFLDCVMYSVIFCVPVPSPPDHINRQPQEVSSNLPYLLVPCWPQVISTGLRTCAEDWYPLLSAACNGVARDQQQ